MDDGLIFPYPRARAHAGSADTNPAGPVVWSSDHTAGEGGGSEAVVGK
jgi:hypothetical protein